MLDNGFPLATESNILKELIKPPTILRTVVNTITGSTNVGEQLPTGQLSVVPWRRTGVKYTNNEAYFDVVEEIDAIIDKSGSTITAEIQGVIDACVKLTGMPDLTLSFMLVHFRDLAASRSALPRPLLLRMSQTFSARVTFFFPHPSLAPRPRSGPPFPLFRFVFFASTRTYRWKSLRMCRFEQGDSSVSVSSLAKVRFAIVLPGVSARSL
ncbi:hypothetical protein SRHO_G00266400 [Serrasalmus rhombeus]